MELKLDGLSEEALRCTATEAVREQCQESGDFRLTPQCCIDLMVLIGRAALAERAKS